MKNDERVVLEREYVLKDGSLYQCYLIDGIWSKEFFPEESIDPVIAEAEADLKVHQAWLAWLVARKRNLNRTSRPTKGRHAL